MKKFFVVLIALTLVAGSAGLSARGFSSGKSFGSSSFKSIRSFNTAPKISAPSSGGANTLTTSRSNVVVVPTYSPPMFFWFPVGGGYSGGNTNSSYGDSGSGWILVLIIGGIILFFLFRPRRTVMAEGDEDKNELELFYDRCQKNLNHLANVYVDAQAWLERLEGKIPHAQYKDWNDRYTKISIADFTKQLSEIRAYLDKGNQVAARAMLFSFDEDAVEVFNFLQEVENAVEDIS